jgi:hypothetical protein
MPAGTVVVDGAIYHKIQGNNGWYQPPDYTEPNMPHDTFWVQHIVKGLVVARESPPDGDRKFWPPFPSFISEHNNTFNRTGLAKLYPTQLEAINTELQSREHLELYGVDGDDQNAKNTATVNRNEDLGGNDASSDKETNCETDSLDNNKFIPSKQ